MGGRPVHAPSRSPPTPASPSSSGSTHRHLDPSARMGPALLARVPPAGTSRLRLADRDSVPDLGFHEPWLLTARWEIGGFRATVATTHLPMASRLPAAQRVAVP